MATTKKVKLTRDEAAQVLPVRCRRWKQLSEESEQVKAKLKPVVQEIKDAVRVMPDRLYEGVGVRAKIVECESVEKKNADNLAKIASTVKADELDVICPRTIDVDQLEARYPELAKRLILAVSERFEIDILQVETPATK